MEKFFLVEKGQQVGPFSKEDLKERNISKTDLVWAEGMENWQKAGNVSVLSDLIAVTPPAIPEMPSAQPVAPPPIQSSPQTQTAPPPPVEKASPPPPPTKPAPPPPVSQNNYSSNQQYTGNPQNQNNFGNQQNYSNQNGYAPQAGGGWIIAGYIFGILGGLIGAAIGAHLKFTKAKLANGQKVKKFNEKSQKHGLIIMIISIVSWVFWMSTM